MPLYGHTEPSTKSLRFLDLTLPRIYEGGQEIISMEAGFQAKFGRKTLGWADLKFTGLPDCCNSLEQKRHGHTGLSGPFKRRHMRPLERVRNRDGLWTRRPSAPGAEPHSFGAPIHEQRGVVRDHETWSQRTWLQDLTLRATRTGI